jgi:threonine dehydratase
MDVRTEALAAEERIRPHVRETVVEHSPLLSAHGQANVYCKLENLQHTGSFKVRGAMNKVLSLPNEARSLGVVAASTGNHGAAVAFCMNKIELPGVIFVPENADRSKIRMIERLGGEVRYHGTDGADTERHARQYATQNGMTYISPYNDPQVIGGQGTIGVELERQVAGIDVLFASLGGGGLLSGTAGYLKSIYPKMQVIGCSPENSQVMIQSVKAGRILELPSRPTLSDGTAGGVEAGAVTFDLCREMIDHYDTVTEEEIKDGLRLFIDAHHMLIEGAAAVAVAAFLRARRLVQGKNVVVIICGGNISLKTLKRVL